MQSSVASYLYQMEMILRIHLPKLVWAERFGDGGGIVRGQLEASVCSANAQFPDLRWRGDHELAARLYLDNAMSHVSLINDWQ